jgi:hypothetical protein
LIDAVHPSGCTCMTCQYTVLAHQERLDRVDEQAPLPDLCSAMTDGLFASVVGHRDHYRHALEVVSDMLRGGDIDAALAHAEEVLRG